MKMYSSKVVSGCSYNESNYTFTCYGVDVPIGVYLEQPISEAVSVRTSIFHEIEHYLNTGNISNNKKAREIHKVYICKVAGCIKEIEQKRKLLGLNIKYTEDLCTSERKYQNRCSSKGHEIRRFLASIPEARRLYLVRDAIQRGDKDTCIAIMDAPLYLSGVDTKNFEELVGRVNFVINPKEYAHIQAFKMAISILNEAECDLIDKISYLDAIVEDVAGRPFWLKVV